MIVVSHTSPLNYLVLINAVDLLPQLFDTVSIPSAVRHELSDPHTPALVHSWVVQPPSWLHIQHLEPGNDATLNALHRGELEAILLAEKLVADLIILDEKAARTIARQRGLQVTGTVGMSMKPACEASLTSRQPWTG